MPITRPKVVAGELYHIYNRGVEKRVIFPSAPYYRRFVDGMRAFNTSRPVVLRELVKESPQADHTGIRSLFEGKRLVEIGAFILMPTHYHFLLRPMYDGGIALFLQKLGAGYSGFFNLKRARVGALFQGRYKIKRIDSDRYARHIQAYIALNALDHAMPEWRQKGVRNRERAMKILRDHPWSSYSSYMERNVFKGIIVPSFIKDFFDSPKEFEAFTLSVTGDEVHDMHGIAAGSPTGIRSLCRTWMMRRG